jgi:hypothetical protein
MEVLELTSLLGIHTCALDSRYRSWLVLRERPAGLALMAVRSATRPDSVQRSVKRPFN